MKKISAKLILILLLLNMKMVSISGAYLADSETSGNNLIRAGVWNVAPNIADVSSRLATPNAINEPQTVINWTTDRPATANLEWKIDSGDPWTLFEPEDTTADKTNQTVTIAGLLPLTTYYYRVHSANQYGRETVSKEYKFATGQFRFDNFFAKSDIVINEFLPNPAGADDAPMPAGEWVELFNRSYTASHDLTGWYLSDSVVAHHLKITKTNSVNSDSTGQAMTLSPRQFLVVYRNGNHGFNLNHDADQVNLFDNTGTLVDQYEYSNNNGDTVLENKSFCRYPDGADTWFDPPATPGRQNLLGNF